VQTVIVCYVCITELSRVSVSEVTGSNHDGGSDFCFLLESGFSCNPASRGVSGVQLGKVAHIG
jgi:hypothetical protein